MLLVTHRAKGRTCLCQNRRDNLFRHVRQDAATPSLGPTALATFSSGISGWCNFPWEITAEELVFVRALTQEDGGVCGNLALAVPWQCSHNHLFVVTLPCLCLGNVPTNHPSSKHSCGSIALTMLPLFSSPSGYWCARTHVCTCAGLLHFA